MAESAGFTEAAHALTHATSPNSDLCRPFVTAIGVTGVAVSTLGDPLGSETVCATDPGAARLDEIQIDLGEGPCWDALATRAPVFEPDLQRSTNAAWPLARHELQAAGLGAVFAFPLVVAGVDVGALDLYSADPMRITDRQVRDTRLLAVILARQVLRRALLTLGQPEEEARQWGGQFNRREVHQATGMIVAQMDLSPADALLVLRGHAFASGRPVREIATDVIAGRLDFSEPPDRTDLR